MEYDYLTGSAGTLSNYAGTWATQTPEALFCEAGGTSDSRTYRQLDDHANAIATSLLDLGVAQSDAIATFMPNRAESAELMFGIHRAGAVFVPCSTHLAADELRYQLEHVGARIVFVDAETLPRMLGIKDKCPAIQQIVVVGDAGSTPEVLGWSQFLEEASPGRVDELPAVSADDLAMIMYTSGTTARPKGIMFSHGHLVAAGLRKVEFLDWSQGDRFLHFFPIYHANGSVSSLVPAVLAGATLVLIPQFSPSRFAQDLVEKRITLCNLNGTHIKMILNTPRDRWDRKHAARRMYLGLMPDEEVIREFERRFDTTLYPGYGLTECLTAIGGSRAEIRRPGSSGRTARGLSLRITGEDGNDVSAGGVGEIRLRGQQRHEVTMGYFRDERRTEAAYGDGWLHTGDLGRVDADGYVWFEGRLKDVIKRSGYSIAAAEVERVINGVEGVTESAVVGTPDRMREEAIVAFVVATDELQDDADAIFKACRENLADYKVPQVVEFMSELPLNFLGKVDRVALRQTALRFRIDSSDRTPLGGPAPR